FFFFFSSRRRHTRLQGDWSSDVCSSDLGEDGEIARGDGAIRADELNIDRRAVAERGSNGPAVQRHGSGNQDDGHLHDCTLRTARSEERRVGKEGRERWARYDEK